MANEPEENYMGYMELTLQPPSEQFRVPAVKGSRNPDLRDMAGLLATGAPVQSDAAVEAMEFAANIAGGLRKLGIGRRLAATILTI